MVGVVAGRFYIRRFFCRHRPNHSRYYADRPITIRRRRWRYAAWLREYGPHTDGIAFAILLGNILAPFFDRLVCQENN